MNYNEWKTQNTDGALDQYITICRKRRQVIDLIEANLSGADLREANLRGATAPFTIGYFGRHTGIAVGGSISIGCERHTYDQWLTDYKKIGREHGYTADEIADYGAWIKLAVARQRRIEQAD